MLKRYIWLAYILLVALAVALGADIVTSYINAKRDMSVVPKPTESRQRRRRQTRAALANNQVIVKRNIFNANPPRKAPPPAAVPQQVQATQLRLELVGTANDVNDQRYAIIADLSQRGDQAVYQTGDVIQQALIVDISRDCVVIDRSGQRESLCLEHETVEHTREARRRPPPTRSTPPTSATNHTGIVRVDATTWRVSRDLFLKQAGSLEAISAHARLLPYRAPGQPPGLLITRLWRDSLLRKIGLRTGDVLQNLNGLSITDPNEAPQAFQQLQNEATIRLDILRRNRTATFTYELR